MVYWSMKHGNGPDIIYYAYANEDFTDLEGTPEPLFLPEDGKACIDGDIVYKEGVYHLFYKTEGHGNGIKVATTRSLTSGEWEEDSEYKQQTRDDGFSSAPRNCDTDNCYGTGTFATEMAVIFCRDRCIPSLLQGRRTVWCSLIKKYAIVPAKCSQYPVYIPLRC